MIIEIYAVKDKAVDAFLQPFFSQSLGSALRSLKQVVNDPNHQFAQSVHDYSLFRLGTFDDLSGVLSPEPDGPSLITPLAGLTDKTPQ